MTGFTFGSFRSSGPAPKQFVTTGRPSWPKSGHPILSHPRCSAIHVYHTIIIQGARGLEGGGGALGQFGSKFDLFLLLLGMLLILPLWLLFGLAWQGVADLAWFARLSLACAGCLGLA